RGRRSDRSDTAGKTSEESDELSIQTEEAAVPITALFEYPDNWQEIIAKRELSGKKAQDQEIRNQMKKRLSADFVDAPANDVVSFLSSVTNTNFVLDPAAVEGDDAPLTLKVKNKPLGEFLEEATASLGLDYEIRNGTVYISTKDRLKQLSRDESDQSKYLSKDHKNILAWAGGYVVDGPKHTKPNDPNTYTFDATKSFDTDKDLTYEWDFGDGTPVQHDGRVSHTYKKPGKYNVTLKVREKNKPDAPVTTATKEIVVLIPDTPDDPITPTLHQSNTPLPPVNPFVLTSQDRLSTFAIDVDTASYAIARQHIQRGFLPPAGSVRMEEFVNAFNYNYPARNRNTFTLHASAADAPFGKGLKLLKVGIRGKVIGRDGRKPAHIVLVVDASGSMAKADRMPLVQYSVRQLLDQLKETDRVTVITCGTEARLAVEALPLVRRKAIESALARLRPEGPTNLLDGIHEGYKAAERFFRSNQINKVILCSDGVANVGETAAEEVLKKVDRYRRQGISITSVGFGSGSYNDAFLEKLANRGDGSYVFVDSQSAAKKVFAQEITSSLQTIAKDVKIQVDFNPDKVRRYRLIGYENRDVKDKDFRNDKVDGGEVGSGQSATALYEFELQNEEDADLGTVNVRFKNPDTDRFEEIAYRLESSVIQARTAQDDPRFFLAAAIAEFAEILRTSEHAKDGDLKSVQDLIERVAVELPLDEQVQELKELVRKAQGLPRRKGN
ncbi:MAG: von Willebrand factor type A domain-containing protein, partial [Planctomycetota bacterium]|nr:von Willebrand factor type A domain-containing protein [Planctomycetota bacterium]